MRLFRRSLLCLVVGVTAFGAAGWVLRPKPTWRVVFPSDEDARPRVLRSLEPTESAPLWIAWEEPAKNDDENEELGRVVAVDPETGFVQANFVRPIDQVDSGVVDGNGHFVVFSRGRDDEGEFEEYQRFDGRSENSIAKFTLPGRWSTTPDEKSLWRLEPVTNGFRFRQASMTDGRVECEFKCLNQYPFYGLREVTLSRDGSRLAFCVKDEAGDVGADGVEIWDVTLGRLIRRIAMPSRILKQEDELSVPVKLRFGNAASDFLLEISDGQTKTDWRLDPKASEFTKKDPEPEAPSDCRDANVGFIVDEINGYMIVVASSQESHDARMRVMLDHQEIHSWDKLPFPLRSGAIGGFDPYVQIDTAIASVPKRKHIVFITLEPSIAMSVPDGLQGLLPHRWNGQNTSRTIWYDWSQMASREVGCGPQENLFQLRPDAYISWIDTFNGLELRSWPLPPRDPKWPALGVAALCTAAAWWVCARRYRRRTRLASVGAA